jgi:ABC-type dipeptide/oligopeptide/nickel transport system ATPase subunit
MNVPVRKFDDVPAVREQVPLLVGLMGPSGSGKTYSALRLASGIQEVTGGEIYGIDTEARRMLHYAEQFKFRHIQFDAPFGSLDYLAAIRHCVAKGAKVIVIDSMSHEHIGPGGYLLTQEAEVQRMAGDDYAKRERVKMAGWIKPSHLRQQMITGILQLNVNFIFCFRAKEKTKPKQGGGIQEMGFMPVAGEELLFEMTVNALLPPKSNGVPQWRSDQVGEKLMMKLPKQFESIFANSKALDEATGRSLAEWAKGDSVSPRAASVTGNSAGPASPAPSLQAGSADTSDDVMAWDSKLASAANLGVDALREVWGQVPKPLKKSLEAALRNRHQPTAEKVPA